MNRQKNSLVKPCGLEAHWTGIMIANKKIDASLVDMGLPRCEKGILRKFNFFYLKL
jgi:hypothetical protein